MTSTDREILLEINGRIMRMESRLENVESRVEVIERRLDIQGTKLEDLQTSVYWVFAGIGILLAISTIFLALMPFMRREEKGVSLSEVIAMINLMRGQASSTPSNDTRTLPSSTANS